MSEKEYIEQLHFCEKHKLICFEFYRRNKDWRRKKRQSRRKVLRRVRECQNELI